MKTLQNTDVLSDLESWFTERTVFSVKKKINTEELYNDYRYFIEDVNKKQPLPRKTFVTQLKLYLQEELKSSRILHIYKSKSCFHGLQLADNGLTNGNKG